MLLVDHGDFTSALVVATLVVLHGIAAGVGVLLLAGTVQTLVSEEHHQEEEITSTAVVQHGHGHLVLLVLGVEVLTLLIWTTVLMV